MELSKNDLHRRKSTEDASVQTLLYQETFPGGTEEADGQGTTETHIICLL